MFSDIELKIIMANKSKIIRDKKEYSSKNYKGSQIGIT